jgi:hypothetical protein
MPSCNVSELLEMIKNILEFEVDGEYTFQPIGHVI